MCAIGELVKSGIQENKITFINLISSPEGIQRLNRTYKSVKVITGVIDETLNENKYILPGILLLLNK